jgi:(p)ppGpp synthase/HD superfamily hydrolase
MKNDTIFTPKIQQAINLAIQTHEIHQKQKRKGKDITYITHPLTVGLILARAGADEDTIIAGILHDTIEDSIPEQKVTKAMIMEKFEEKVADLVDSVTEQNKSLTWDERKQEALAHIQDFSNESLLVKSADIISNASELLEDYKMEGENVFARFNAGKEKILQHYLHAISTIVLRWAESPLTPDLQRLSENLELLKSGKLT